jgi:hypothetical protein
LAYIRQYKGRWRAEVQRHGNRATYMADTKRARVLAHAQALMAELARVLPALKEVAA